MIFYWRVDLIEPFFTVVTMEELKILSEPESSFSICPWSSSASNSCITLSWMLTKTILLFCETVILEFGFLTYQFY